MSEGKEGKPGWIEKAVVGYTVGKLEKITGMTLDEAVEEFKKVQQEARGIYDDHTKSLQEKSLQFLNLAADTVTLPENKKASLLLQTGLGTIGIPGGLSLGDCMELLRVYQNFRHGDAGVGTAELIAALLPGTPIIEFGIQRWRKKHPVTKNPSNNI